MFYNRNLAFQKYDNKLEKRLKEIIVSTNTNILIALPKILNLRKHPQPHWKPVLELAKPKLKQILPHKYYGDAFTTRTAQNVEQFKLLWTDKDIIIVEGDKTRSGVDNNLFDNVKSLQRILTPNEHAFDKYEEILEECKKQDKDKVFILSVGPTATVLAYDLTMHGYYALDIGHMDMVYDWDLYFDNNNIKREGKYTNEAAGGRENIAPCLDEHYLKSIIADLS